MLPLLGLLQAVGSPPANGPLMSVAAAERIVAVAAENWPESRRREEAVDPATGRKEFRLVGPGEGRIATYELAADGQLASLSVNSSPYPQCRPFANPSRLADAIVRELDGGGGEEDARFLGNFLDSMRRMNSHAPIRVGAYVVRAFRAGPGRGGCHDHLSIARAGSGERAFSLPSDRRH